jgi:YVTN family beta-propeller protein
MAVAAVLSGLILSNADAAPGRSTTTALTSDETRVVVNREASSLSIINVKNPHGNDVSNKLAEIAVGEEPRCVAVSPNDRFAFVTSAISATVSVVNLVQNRVVKTIKVGTEPRGCALQAIPRVAAQPGWASLKEKTSASQG